MIMSRAQALRVLVVVEDEDVRASIEHVVREEGDTYAAAASVEDATALAAGGGFDVAFIELRAENGAGLALCHHLPSASPGARVQAIVHPLELDRGPEALSLGASGLLVAPPTGDAIARVLSDAKAERARRREVAALEATLARERRRLETYDRLVRFARGAAPSDAVRAIAEGVSQLSAAQGVALYAAFGDDERERVLLAAIGTARDLPASCPPAELSRLIQARAARAVPLLASAGPIGVLVLDRAPGPVEPEIGRLADLAAAMLALVDQQDPGGERLRAFAPKHFHAVAERLLTLAQRHGRRCSVLAISLAGETPEGREEATRAIAEVVRTTDALSGLEEGDLVLFLPETGGLGAQACRRRIAARLYGDRRARPKPDSTRGHEPHSRRAPPAIGAATFPHDGATLAQLVRAARGRARDEARSAVHALALDALPLGEIVDALLAQPMLAAGARSSYPLDIAGPALFALVASVCREAPRGGEASVTTTLQPGLGVAAAARQAGGTARVFDVRGEPGCGDIEAVAAFAEHGAWVCCGRVVAGRFRGVHAADPLLADVIERRLSAAGAPNAG